MNVVLIQRLPHTALLDHKAVITLMHVPCVPSQALSSTLRLARFSTNTLNFKDFGLGSWGRVWVSFVKRAGFWDTCVQP